MAEKHLVHIYASYVPRVILEHVLATFADDPKPGREPRRCAVMFADISGFTPLTETLAQRGPSGAEELTEILNSYFGKLIDIVTVHGGDVVKFAGDALMATWWGDGDGTSLHHETSEAAACALDVQGELTDYAVGNDVVLRMRVTIGAGDAAVFHVGGALNRWEFMIAGPPLNQIAAATDLTAPGEVVLSSEAWNEIREVTSCEEIDGDAVRLLSLDHTSTRVWRAPAELHDDMEETVRRFIPAAIIHRLVAGQRRWLGELRRITIIFVNLPGFTYETPIELAHDAMLGMQTALYRYEGSINKLSVDDKGVTLISALGLPPLAHEDDAARGVKAAMAMRDALHALDLECSIGVTTGRVYCGAVGSSVRREYTIMGAVVNLAARLMQHADGDVLCDAPTRDAATGEVEFTDRRTLDIKGKKEPVPVFRPLRSRAREVTPREEGSGIVGRQTERDLMSKRLDAMLQHGRSGVVLLEGEAGIGKSRLVEDSMNVARSVGARVFFGAADAIEKAKPYYAWQSIIAKRLGIEQLDTLEDRRAHVVEELEELPELSHLAPLLNTVLPLEFPETELTEQMSGEVRALNLQDLILGLLQITASVTPIVIILEDAHWLDSASWALALQASRRLEPMLLMIATRDLGTHPPMEYRQLASSMNADAMHLEALPRQHALELVSRSLGVKALPDQACELIWSRAEGHPYFSEEIGYGLRDAGMIIVDGDQCRMANGDGEDCGVDLPDTIEGIITSRIDQLTPPQQLTLKVASVVGRVFTVAAVHNIYPETSAEQFVLDQLKALERLDLTPLDTPEPERAYLFKHIITREVAYDLMLFAQRQRLHRDLAQWYESHYIEDRPLHFELLAHHWGRAGNSDKEISYLEHAGRQALRNFANAEAISFLETALARDAESGNPSEPLRRGHWHRLMGQAERARGHFPEAREYLEQAAATLGFAIPGNRVAVVAKLMVEVARQAWYRLRPNRKKKADSREQRIEAAEVLETLMMVYYFESEPERLMYATLKAVNLAESVEEPGAVLPRSYGSMTAAAAAVPLRKQGRYYSDKALARAAEIDQVPVWTWVYLTIATREGGIGRWDAAEELYRKGLELADRLGDHRRWEECAASLGAVQTLRGNIAAAIELGEGVFDSGRHRGDPQAQGWGLVIRVRCAWILDRWEDLEQLLVKLNELVGTYGGQVDRMCHLDCHTYTALFHLRNGMNDEAARSIERAIAVLDSIGRPNQYHIHSASSHLVEAALTLEQRVADGSAGADAADAKRWVKRSLRNLATFSLIYPIGKPRLWLVRGLAAKNRGRIGKARRAWQRCSDLAVKFGTPYAEARASRELAESLPDGSSERAALQTRTEELVKRLNESP